jgi:hypothetical protein
MASGPKGVDPAFISSYMIVWAHPVAMMLVLVEEAGSGFTCSDE